MTSKESGSCSATQNEHERKLALIREFETEKGAITQRGLELMNVANTQYEQDRLNAQWEIWRNQSQANQFLADGLDALGQRSTNVLTGLLTQTQSINDAFQCRLNYRRPSRWSSQSKWACNRLRIWLLKVPCVRLPMLKL